MTYKLPEGRTIRVLFHSCAVRRLAQQVCWSDLRADTGTLFFHDKIQTKRSHTQLHKEESLFFVKGMMVAPLTTAGVSDEVAQELQMPIGPQMLEEVEEPIEAGTLPRFIEIPTAPTKNSKSDTATSTPDDTGQSTKRKTSRGNFSRIVANILIRRCSRRYTATDSSMVIPGPQIPKPARPLSPAE